MECPIERNWAGRKKRELRALGIHGNVIGGSRSGVETNFAGTGVGLIIAESRNKRRVGVDRSRRGDKLLNDGFIV